MKRQLQLQDFYDMIDVSRGISGATAVVGLREVDPQRGRVSFSVLKAAYRVPVWPQSIFARRNCWKSHSSAKYDLEQLKQDFKSFKQPKRNTQ